LGKYKNLFYKDKDGWQLNEIGYLIMLKHKMFCEYMFKQFEEMGENAFICEQLKWINLKYEKESWIKEVINIEKVNNLEEYLESVIGKRLYKNEQKELIDIIGLKDKLGRIQKSIRQFNAYFEANRIPYIIISKTSSRLINEGQKKSIRFWEVISIDNDLEIPQNL